MLKRVVMCCDMLGDVSSNFKMIKLFMPHLRILHDVVVVWPGLCMLRPTMLRFVAFDSWDRLAGAL